MLLNEWIPGILSVEAVGCGEHNRVGEQCATAVLDNVPGGQVWNSLLVNFIWKWADNFTE
jgi:hypothetical protein